MQQEVYLHVTTAQLNNQNILIAKQKTSMLQLSIFINKNEIKKRETTANYVLYFLIKI
ncbi:hypothetical protein MEI_00807 [Bartonella vinsonii subsp. arupensis Pm136co]|uniref:Uncharacterized protein n=1 Tax=Bartonella vinsonii subsp. arupensis Pm136co TaxID=1094561 RepID=A0ABP2QTN1_BARVI|nr:hypothetical protein MEI_00807 [Bartonella vinsonii subsp. arupensis Pm136co]